MAMTEPMSDEDRIARIDRYIQHGTNPTILDCQWMRDEIDRLRAENADLYKQVAHK
jgi:hypothetical protein